jgi:uncharacterized protein YecT (DUF1311 family)
MNTAYGLFAAALFTLFPCQVIAQRFQCNPGGSQAELNVCAADAARSADDELNDVYRQVIACRADEPAFIDNLRSAQRLWIQFRDAELEARFPVPEGANERILYGSMYPLHWLGEKERLTKERSVQLRRLMDADDPILLARCTGASPSETRHGQ